MTKKVEWTFWQVLVAGSFASGHHGDESENEPNHEEYEGEDVQHYATKYNNVEN